MPSLPKSIQAPDLRENSVSRSPFSRSFIASSPLAQASIEQDLLDASDDDDGTTDEDDLDSGGESSEASTIRPENYPHSMSSTYRRPSFVAFGGPRGAVPPLDNVTYLSKKEKRQSRHEEESLLRDNHLAPPKHPQPTERSALAQMYQWAFSPRRPQGEGDEENQDVLRVPSETSLLLPNGELESNRTRNERLNRQWEEAVAAGRIKTTWQRETKTLVRYSSPLVVTFVLQYSLTVASIFTVGHIGKLELGAVSLAAMTANITGYAIYAGLATSLDTLCAQAYGSGKKQLVGLQLQRMVYFLWFLTIPIGIIWLSAEKILEHMVPEKRSAELAGLYLRILLLGSPGYAAFESGKRFVQAQGLFSATTYVLLVAAPINAFMNWLFVWHFDWGFVGAPIAVAITDTMLPIMLFLYVYFVDGRQCWNGFTKKAFKNWGPMVKLALPGLLMVEAEYLAFEVLTLAASYFSTAHLAAQSVLSTITALTFQIPFSISIAASTRVANLIGATLTDAAKTSAKVSYVVAVFTGVFNVVLLSSLRNVIPQLFTNDEAVIELVAQVLPICAAFQLFDAITANCNGLLRGLGFQEVGGYVNLFCYYIVAMPISFGTAFGLGWGLSGLWCGVAVALGLVAAIEVWVIYNADWQLAVDDAQGRNAAG
ncbi:mate efflux family protein [Phlyctema vagabunda]|uniref:Mate efflux family protein n=1 Tax=Phlyctema vagabunda TaxID=108571 RepID=A0ABR4P902_9HELO